MKIYRIDKGAEDWFKKFRIWKSIWKYKKIIDDADVIHIHDVFFWYLPFRFLYLRKRVFTTFHGYETKFPISKKAIAIRKLSEKLSTGNICIGDYIKKWYGTKPDYVIYGGVNKVKTAEIKNITPNSKLTIVLIGRFDKDIGVIVYLKSLTILKKRKAKFVFQSFGDGKLKKSVGKFGKVHGFVNDTGSEIEKADIIFSSSYLTILEALIRKRIVISVYENPLKEDYLKNSPFARFIFICKNPTEVAIVVESIRKDPWKYRSMLENGYNWAMGEAWEKVANTYVKLWSA